MRMISLASTRVALAGIGVAAGSVTAAAGISLPASAQTLIWSVVPSPSPSATSDFLYGVSCVSATACTAAGTDDGGTAYSRTLIESGSASG